MYGDAAHKRPHLAVTNVLIMEWFNQCGVRTASTTILKSWIHLMIATEAFGAGASVSNVGSVSAHTSVQSWRRLCLLSRMEPAKSSTVKNWHAASASPASNDPSLPPILSG